MLLLFLNVVTLYLCNSDAFKLVYILHNLTYRQRQEMVARQSFILFGRQLSHQRSKIGSPASELLAAGVPALGGRHDGNWGGAVRFVRGGSGHGGSSRCYSSRSSSGRGDSGRGNSGRGNSGRGDSGSSQGNSSRGNSGRGGLN